MEKRERLAKFVLIVTGIAKPLLIASVCYLAGLNAYEWLTDNKIENVRHFQKGDNRGAVINGDTAYFLKQNAVYIEPLDH